MTADALARVRALRQRRAAAAHALAEAGARAEAGWDDLAHWPDWALLAPDRIEALAWACGAWLHAGALCHCIDGRVWDLLRERVGPQACAMLRGEPASADSALQLRDPVDTLFAESGRGVLLAGIEAPALRRALRALCWAGVPCTEWPALSPAAARALADRALACLPAGKAAP